MSIHFVRKKRVCSDQFIMSFRERKYEICGKNTQQIILATTPEQDFFHL